MRSRHLIIAPTLDAVVRVRRLKGFLHEGTSHIFRWLCNMNASLWLCVGAEGRSLSHVLVFAYRLRLLAQRLRLAARRDWGQVSFPEF
jgi:hypothetical protein